MAWQTTSLPRCACGRSWNVLSLRRDGIIARCIRCWLQEYRPS